MSTPALHIAGLSHRYGARLALDGVSLNVAPGEFRVLLGPNGAGKSTLYGLLTRLLACQSGAIELFGQPLSAPAMAGLGVVFQQPTLDLDLTVEQNLAYFAALHGLRGSERRARIDAELQRMALGERRHERVRLLNGGHRRRVEIARALLHRPRLLLLDEATVGLDMPARRFLVEHVHRLAREEGLAVLWATHLIDEVRADDHIALLHQGRLLASGVAGELTAQAECDSLAQWFDRQTGKEDSACLWP